MLKLSEYLAENFKNLLIKDVDKRNQYAQEVWDVLQSSYSDIGGIKGSGFESVDSMVKNSPFWKLIVKASIVHGVIMYKDSGGRKSVALGVLKGSSYGIKMLRSVLKNDLKVSYGELSKAALGMMLKINDKQVILPFIHTPEESSIIIKKDTTPIKDIPKVNWPADAVVTIEKYPFLIDYGYVRTLKGKDYFKVLIGKEGLHIR